MKNNTTKHTLENVLAVPEVVINLVDYNMVHACSLASADFDRGVSEFEKAGLTALPSDTVKPKRVAESLVALECKVLRVDSLGEEGGAGQLVVCEIQRMHFRSDVLNEAGQPVPDLLDLVGVAAACVRPGIGSGVVRSAQAAGRTRHWWTPCCKRSARAKF